MRAIEMVFGAPVRTMGGEIGSLPSCKSSEAALLFRGKPSHRSMALLKQSGRSHIYPYAVVPSPSIPRWMIPVGDHGASLAATQIYYPHKWAAKTLKTLLAALIRLGCEDWLRKVFIASSDVPLLEKLVRDITGEREIRFALSMGRQAAVRKLTVQVMRPNGEILGYIKLPLTDVATQRVRNEAKILERLWSFSRLRSHIPRLLYAGDWNGSYLLFQSPLDGEVGPVSLRDLHKKFLATLRECHAVEKPGQAVVEEVGVKWRQAAPLLSDEWRALGEEALRRSKLALQDKRVTHSVVHGDFAPWNTRVYHDELRLFDWESAMWEGPSGWDIFHFRMLTTSAFNERETYLPFDLPVAEQGSFMLYLVDSVSQFLQEENPEQIRLRQQCLRRFLNGDDVASARLSSVTL
jgi:Phosphotransferase enzyme family